MDPKHADLYIPGVGAFHILQEGDEEPEGWRITPTHIPGLTLAHQLGGNDEKPDSGRRTQSSNEGTCPSLDWWAQSIPAGNAA